jgi:hypothetical protein
VKRVNLLAGYQSYGTRTVDLSGISACNNNANFAMRFRWQLNTDTDTADLDNITVTGEVADLIPPTATIGPPSVTVTRVGPVSYSVSFSEPVTGFNSPTDIQVNSTGSAAAGSVSVSGSGSGPYTVTLSSITGDGTLGIIVKGAACTDMAGNANTASSPSATARVLGADGSIADLKQLPNESPVSLGNKILYLKQGSFGYIEETDRSSGIRVQGSITASQGDLVCLTGTMQMTAGGERYIQASGLSPNGTATLKPLGMSNRALRHSLADGLYITTWGRVKVGSVTGNSYVITDGSDEAGIKVITPGSPGVTEGQYVTVVGAVGFDTSRVIYRR